MRGDAGQLGGLRWRSQRGVALITALLVVALVSIAAASMMERQQLDIRRTAQLLQSDQAFAYTIALEDFAAVMLLGLDQERDVDHFGEVWAGDIDAIRADQPQSQLKGMVLRSLIDADIAFEITDLQGRFHLNNLINREGEVVEAQRQMLLRLLRGLRLDDAEGEGWDGVEGLVARLLDWLDRDVDPRPGGAEDSDYLALSGGGSAAYRAANQPLSSLTELHLIRGFDAVVVGDGVALEGGEGESERGCSFDRPWVRRTVYQLLAPCLSALPPLVEGGVRPINVNTAAAPVLLALDDRLDRERAEQLAQQPPAVADALTDYGVALVAEEATFYKSVEAFLAEAPFVVSGDQDEANRKRNEALKPLLTVASEHFLLDSAVTVDRFRLQSQTLLWRDDQRVQVVGRAFGRL